MGDKQKIISAIESKAGLFTGLSDQIWNFAETRFCLRQSADALSAVLKDEGFTVERGVAGMAHAFVASFGSGAPVIGILGEYDALPGLSQEAGNAEKKALREGAAGHGCGHHLLGAGALAGAVGIKDYMKETGLGGTVKFFGCPAEEAGSGKAFMARAGLFNGIDGILTWHPMTETGIFSMSSLANYQVYFGFKGVAAHAAAAPHYGRSALDAAELMNVGVNYLREHVIQEARIHYAYIDVGGKAPNVVQPTAELLYYIRAPKTSQAREIYERIIDIAKGAALMTGTVMNMRWDSYCAEYLVNDVLGRAMHTNVLALGPNQYTAEELAFAQKFGDTLSEPVRKGIAANVAAYFGDDPQRVAEIAAKPIIDDIMPYVMSGRAIPGSTDVGDASWHAPTAQLIGACFPTGMVAHSWQMVACGCSAIAHKGMIQAGKVIAMTALDMLENPDLLARAKVEHSHRLAGETYHCPFPPEHTPEE
ncbi:aminobenzoyl-glutamate utilization protein B [Spirochaetia bacterium]|nr:aminobenzoyl-glutamate utilization protein B [Spirochaetia bacterium]